MRTWEGGVSAAGLGWSVGLVRGEERSVDWFHAGRTGEGAHEPVVYAVHVVDVHAGQEPDGVAVYKVHHTNHAPKHTHTKKEETRFVTESGLSLKAMNS